MARSRKQNALSSLFDEADSPIYMLDTDRRLQYCNQACCDWTECSSDQLQGVRWDYHTLESDPPPIAALSTERVSAGLCPSPDAFSGVSSHGIVAVPGSRQRRQAEFIPLLIDGHVAGVLVIVASRDSDCQPLSKAADAFDPTKLHEQLHYWRHCQRDLYRVDLLVGSSVKMQRVRDQVSLASAGQGTVLAVGPPGSGRERVLRTIYSSRSRSEQVPLIPLDCRLLDTELMQSTMDDLLRESRELEGTDGVDLLLLEVDQLSLDCQVVLLNFLCLDELEVTALATSETDLVTLSENAGFVADLAEKLTTLVIRLPTLRERPDDLPMLIQAAIENENAAGGKQILGTTQRAMDLLLAHRWTGNLDQLFEFVRQAHQVAAGSLITENDLPEAIGLSIDADRHPPRQVETIDLGNYLTEIERELIQRALVTAGGNKAQAARLLGISRGRLLRRLETLKISS
ncbi:MAG: sigma-54-dependent Fis family transcriptional regulator [Planctomycetaceae bacterium]|nr:sigma-54-dependent Fis family transcriptional regulator [Planctomycetaceae bacterium]